MKQSSDTKEGIQLNGSGGSGHIKGGLDCSSQQPSTSSDTNSKSSKRLWRQPKTIRQFASQASVVCTMLLNGKLDLETAKAYSAIARTVAQSATAEVTRARFLEQAPELSFETDVFDD